MTVLVWIGVSVGSLRDVDLFEAQVDVSRFSVKDGICFKQARTLLTHQLEMTGHHYSIARCGFDLLKREISPLRISFLGIGRLLFILR